MQWESWFYLEIIKLENIQGFKAEIGWVVTMALMGVEESDDLALQAWSPYY